MCIYFIFDYEIVEVNPRFKNPAYKEPHINDLKLQMLLSQLKH